MLDFNHKEQNGVIYVIEFLKIADQEINGKLNLLTNFAQQRNQFKWVVKSKKNHLKKDLGGCD